MGKPQGPRADTIIVLDFETTGLSPDKGDRAIEVGAVRVVNGVISERYQSLMNPGRRISGFIEDYTGISNAMLQAAPPCKTVMAEFAEFCAGYNLVAHNASFDSRFLTAELDRIRRRPGGEFACSMLLARRLYPEAPNHKLGTLVQYHALPSDGTFHRALADAEMTAHLWLKMLTDLAMGYQLHEVSFSLLQRISKTPRQAVPGLLKTMATDTNHAG